jgi:DnaK suppressor protein
MDELSDDQRAELRADLLTLKHVLSKQIVSSEDSARPVDLDEPIGRLSRMDAMQQQKMLAANRSAARMRQHQADAALARFDDDEYGDCQSCGESIGYGRLKASPEAPFCLDCQSQRERRD